MGGIRSRTEVLLLLCCAPPCTNSERAESIRGLVRQNIDWEYLISMAIVHRTMPLLYRGLNAFCSDLVPSTIFAHLEERFHLNAQHNVFLTSELLRLLDLLERHGIPAIPFKGPVLAVAVYGNFLLRQFDDLDILIREEDLLKAKEILDADGYRLQLNRKRQIHFRKYRYHYHFRRNDSRIELEVHWKVTRRYWSSRSINPDLLWERLERISIAGRDIPSLHPEDLIHILCVHGSKHFWPRLLWICDVSELIRVHSAMNWGRVIKRAAEMGNRRVLFLGLLLANDLLGTPIPRGMAQPIEIDPILKSLTKQVREQLFSRGDPFGYFQVPLFHFRVRESLSDRILYCLVYFCPYLCKVIWQVISPNEKDRSFVPLPKPLFFLHYPIKPVRLFRTYGFTLLKRILGSLVIVWISP